MTSWPTDGTPDPARFGAAGFELLRDESHWVNRRVQAVVIFEPELIRSRLSVDFVLPRAAGAYVPITTIPDWPPMYEFSLTDGNGRPVRLLTSPDSERADEALLLEALRQAGVPAGDKVIAEAVPVLAGKSLNVEREFGSLSKRAEELATDDDALRVALDVAGAFTCSKVLWYPTSGMKPGDPEIAKVEYVTGSGSETPGRRVARSLAWSRKAERLPLWHLGTEANFHLRFEAPPVLRVCEADLEFQPPKLHKDKRDDKQPVTAALTHPQTAGRISHRLVTGRRSIGAELVFRLAPFRTGVVLASWVASVLSTILAWVAFFQRCEFAQNADASVAVLTLIPALIGFLLVRPSDAPVLRKYLRGVQTMVVVAAAVPAAMAVMLVAYSGHPGSLYWPWLISASVATLVSCGLLLSVVRSG